MAEEGRPKEHVMFRVEQEVLSENEKSARYEKERDIYLRRYRDLRIYESARLAV